MRYYAQYDDNNKLIAIGTGFGGTEVTQEEYNSLLAQIREKVKLVNRLYKGEITLSDIPTDWQKEIQERVDNMKAQKEEEQKQEISSEEFYSMVEEVL